jgi:hypothetical protein
MVVRMTGGFPIIVRPSPKNAMRASPATDTTTPMDPELFQRMQEAAARFKSGETDFEEIITPAGPVHLVRDAGDPRGFTLDFVGAGARGSVPVQEYPASPTRSPGYPAPLPFVANCAATVNTVDQSVVWVDPPGGGDAFENVVRQMVDEGWVPVETDGALEGGEVRVLAKDGAERTLSLGVVGGIRRMVLSGRR